VAFVQNLPEICLMPNQRIISLLPSATETVCCLGLQGNLVGRSHECDFPPAVEHLPVCSYPRYQSDGPSPVIDRAVREILETALSIYKVDVETISRLKPTHIITQSQCAVCAVSTAELRDALCECILADGIEVIDVSPHTLDEVFADIHTIATSLDVEARGIELAGWMRREVSEDRIADGTPFPQTPGCAHRVDRPADGRRALDADADKVGGRDKCLSGRNEPMDNC
jgi:iron complex transport system substrate-binding protein